jgi:hypothetical protein
VGPAAEKKERGGREKREGVRGGLGRWLGRRLAGSAQPAVPFFLLFFLYFLLICKAFWCTKHNQKIINKILMETL